MSSRDELISELEKREARVRGIFINTMQPITVFLDNSTASIYDSSICHLHYRFCRPNLGIYDLSFIKCYTALLNLAESPKQDTIAFP